MPVQSSLCKTRPQTEDPEALKTHSLSLGGTVRTRSLDSHKCINTPRSDTTQAYQHTHQIPEASNSVASWDQLALLAGKSLWISPGGEAGSNPARWQQFHGNAFAFLGVCHSPAFGKLGTGVPTKILRGPKVDVMILTRSSYGSHWS